MKILPDSNQPAPDVCIGRSLESKDNTPEADETKDNRLEADENENKSDDGEDGDTPEADENEDESVDGEDTEIDDDTIVSTAANRTTSGKSEYSRI
jgi:hypothetical protein